MDYSINSLQNALFTSARTQDESAKNTNVPKKYSLQPR